MKLTFRILDGVYAVARLAAASPFPEWLPASGFVSITRTSDELSIVCLEAVLPSDIRSERDWRCLQLLGPIPFEMTGVAAGFTAPLANAGISVFVVSTYDTDYLMVKAEVLERAIAELEQAGFTVGYP